MSDSILKDYVSVEPPPRIPPSPCEFFDCRQWKFCGQWKVACEAFVEYVRKSEVHPPATSWVKCRSQHDGRYYKTVKIKLVNPMPTRELYDLAFSKEGDEEC